MHALPQAGAAGRSAGGLAKIVLRSICRELLEVAHGELCDAKRGGRPFDDAARAVLLV